MPPDHMHQHGIFFANVSTEFEGKSVDFWNSYKHEGLRFATSSLSLQIAGRCSVLLLPGSIM